MLDSDLHRQAGESRDFGAKPHGLASAFGFKSPQSPLLVLRIALILNSRGLRNFLFHGKRIASGVSNPSER